MFSNCFNFQVEYLENNPKIICKFVTFENEIISLKGNTIEEIFDLCVKKFPNGVRTKGIFFEGKSHLDAKISFCNLITLGLKTGYFKESDFLFQELEDDIF
jgi:hypothetical protein